MKNLELMLLAIATMLFIGMGSLNAQKHSSVIITTISTGDETTLQVIDDNNNLSFEKEKISAEKPEQLILKLEIQKWLNKGYILSQSYGYVETTNSYKIFHKRYETVILTKSE